MNNPFKLSCLTLLACLSLSLFADDAKNTSNGIEIKQGAAKLQIGGQIQLDYDHFEEVHNNGETGNNSEQRRGRLYFKGLLNNWEAKLQINVNSKKKEIELKDVYVRHKDLYGIQVTIGNAKEPFGLEMLNSSKYILAIERAMASAVFAPSRSYGFTLSTKGKKGTFATGIYNEAHDEFSQDIFFAWTSRMTYTPIMTKDSILHVGLAGSLRDMAGKEYQIKNNAEVHLANKIVKSGATVANKVSLLGLEMAAIFGSLSLQSEYMTAFVDADSESGDHNAQYDGYYVQIGYFLTGEIPYYKKGLFKGKVKPYSDHGAWQLLVRGSYLDASDNNAGVEAENLTLGINYYATPNLRLSANYIMTGLKGDSDAKANEDNGEALSLRFQYLF
ncbi:Phosphate-selective porin O/P [Candidatus Thiomargarita nelsonii]|uniref:Phosphate-selective porin O/P n=1 Tax=Candidatus Thiomargarita nelsonii TaxID=1003181 RepID=A0A176S654_9GAMM|nr:Phosphate-selective porin O/P [Candidatus Thiomargarita nelsonii]